MILNEEEIKQTYIKFGTTKENVAKLLATERYHLLMVAGGIPTRAFRYMDSANELVCGLLANKPFDEWQDFIGKNPIFTSEIEKISRGAVGFTATGRLRDFLKGNEDIARKDILKLTPMDFAKMREFPDVGPSALKQLAEVMAVVEATKRFSKFKSQVTRKNFEAAEMSLMQIKKALRDPSVRQAVRAELAKYDTMK